MTTQANELPAEAGRTITDAEWAQRFTALREAEWRSRCRFQDLAEDLIGRVEKLEKPTIKDFVVMVELASKFGRLAIEGVEEPPKCDDAQQDFLRRVEHALNTAFPTKTAETVPPSNQP